MLKKNTKMIKTWMLPNVQFTLILNIKKNSNCMLKAHLHLFCKHIFESSRGPSNYGNSVLLLDDVTRLSPLLGPRHTYD